MAEKPEDLNLPASVVTRIIKEALPEGVSVAKEARQAVSKAASVFVLYCTACANAHATKVKRKTLLGNDVLAAMNDMEFEHFIPDLKESLAAFRKDQKEKKENAAERRKAAQMAAAQSASGDGESVPGDAAGDGAAEEGSDNENAPADAESLNVSGGGDNLSQ